MLEPGVQITTLKCGSVMLVILYQKYTTRGAFFMLEFRL